MRLADISNTQTIDLTPQGSRGFTDGDKILHNPFWDLPSPLCPVAQYYSPNQLLPRNITDLLDRQGARHIGGLWHVAIVAEDGSGAVIAEALYSKESGPVTCVALKLKHHHRRSQVEAILVELGSRVWGEPVDRPVAIHAP